MYTQRHHGISANTVVGEWMQRAEPTYDDRVSNAQPTGHTCDDQLVTGNSMLAFVINWLTKAYGTRSKFFVQVTGTRISRQKLDAIAYVLFCPGFW